MQYTSVTVATLAMLWTILADTMENEIEPTEPNDHIVEQYMEDSLKYLLYDIKKSAQEDINITDADDSTLPSKDPYIHRIECKGKLRDNLIDCIKDRLPQDIQCIRNYWKFDRDFPHIDTLLGPVDVDQIPDIPDCVKFCMKWARGALVDCNWQADELNVQPTKNRFFPKVSRTNPSSIYFKRERHPYYPDRNEESSHKDISNGDGQAQPSHKKISYEDGKEFKVLCAWLAVATLDSCLEEIVIIEDLKQLRNYWTLIDTQSVIKLFVSPEYNEFEDVPKEIKDCMVQAKESFTLCMILGISMELSNVSSHKSNKRE